MKPRTFRRYYAGCLILAAVNAWADVSAGLEYLAVFCSMLLVLGAPLAYYLGKNPPWRKRKKK